LLKTSRKPSARNGNRQNMKLFIAFLVLVTASCGKLPYKEAAQLLAPPAYSNVYVVKKVPICSYSLTEPQRRVFQAALDVWNLAVPEMGLRQSWSKPCTGPGPRVEIDPDLGRKGWTTFCAPGGRCAIKYQSEAVLRSCTGVHEVGHLMLIRHAAAGEPLSPMSDGDRGKCTPTSADRDIIIRTLKGRVSL